MKRIGLLAWVMVLGILVAAGTAPAGQNGNGAFAGQQTLSAVEEQNLAFLREEEKLAQDVYLYLFDVWGQRIFENIAASEQQHMDAVKNLLLKYRLDDPALDAEGDFTNDELQELYNYLIAIGGKSKLAALQVGVAIEEKDIYDLQEILSETVKPDIIQVCENLMKGSRNHLRAFVGEIELQGGTYELEYLTQEQVDEIVNSPREKGPY